MENRDCMDKFYVPNAFIVGFEIATVFVNTRHAGLVPLYSNNSEKTARQSHLHVLDGALGSTQRDKSSCSVQWAPAVYGGRFKDLSSSGLLQ